MPPPPPTMAKVAETATRARGNLSQLRSRFDHSPFSISDRVCVCLRHQSVPVRRNRAAIHATRLARTAAGDRRTGWGGFPYSEGGPVVIVGAPRVCAPPAVVSGSADRRRLCPQLHTSRCCQHHSIAAGAGAGQGAGGQPTSTCRAPRASDRSAPARPGATSARVVVFYARRKRTGRPAVMA